MHYVIVLDTLDIAVLFVQISFDRLQVTGCGRFRYPIRGIGLPFGSLGPTLMRRSSVLVSPTL